jgi:hypothetical protein
VEVWLKVAPQADEPTEESASWRAFLSEELLELDEVALREVSAPVPGGAKGAGDLAALAVRIPVSGVVALAQFLQAWAARTGRTVEASIDGDTIKITGASREQQERIIEAWLVSHTSSA